MWKNTANYFFGKEKHSNLDVVLFLLLFLFFIPELLHPYNYYWKTSLLFFSFLLFSKFRFPCMWQQKWHPSNVHPSSYHLQMVMLGLLFVG